MQILLVRKDKQQRVLHFSVLDDAGELGAGLLDAVAVIGVNDEDEPLCACGLVLAGRSPYSKKMTEGRAGDHGGCTRQSGTAAHKPTRNRVAIAQHTGEVVSPQRAYLVLAADIPDVEFGVLVRDGLDVEADGGDGGDVLVELELVEDGWTGRQGSAIGKLVGCRRPRTRLSGGIEAQHQQPHLLGSEDLVHHL